MLTLIPITIHPNKKGWTSLYIRTSEFSPVMHQIKGYEKRTFLLEYAPAELSGETPDLLDEYLLSEMHYFACVDINMYQKWAAYFMNNGKGKVTLLPLHACDYDIVDFAFVLKDGEIKTAIHFEPVIEPFKKTSV